MLDVFAHGALSEEVVEQSFGWFALELDEFDWIG
jgi:hypothetical protein